MGKLRHEVTPRVPQNSNKRKSLNPYRATKLWNQVVSGFKRLMPLRSHRVRFNTYDDCFKRSEGQAWLVQFIAESKLLVPISLDKAGVLLDKFVEMDIIEEACKIKPWLRSPTVIYKFSAPNQNRVEKLRTLRYYSRTPQKGTTVNIANQDTQTTPLKPPRPASVHLSRTKQLSDELDKENIPSNPIGRANHHSADNPSNNPCSTDKICLADNENPAPLSAVPVLPVFRSSPHPKKAGLLSKKVSLKRSDTICTPCKRTERSDVLFSSTPNGKVYHGNDLANSPYLKALRNLNERGVTVRKSNRSVKRLGNKGPLKNGLVKSSSKNSNAVIDGICHDFDELIMAIDKFNT